MTWQPTAVIYPDAEAVVITALKARLVAEGFTSASVLRTLPPAPTPRPAQCVQVIRDGGNAAELRDKARLRVLCWDTTDLKVSTLARTVVAVMPLLAGSNGVLRTEHLSGPYEIPDAAPKRYLLFEVHFRGEAL